MVFQCSIYVKDSFYSSNLCITCINVWGAFLDAYSDHSTPTCNYSKHPNCSDLSGHKIWKEPKTWKVDWHWFDPANIDPNLANLPIYLHMYFQSVKLIRFHLAISIKWQNIAENPIYWVFFIKLLYRYPIGVEITLSYFIGFVQDK